MKAVQKEKLHSIMQGNGSLNPVIRSFASEFDNIVRTPLWTRRKEGRKKSPDEKRIPFRSKFKIYKNVNPPRVETYAVL